MCGLVLMILLSGAGEPSAQPGDASTCESPDDCRTRAEAAAARGEYETFHTLAWRAVQTGKRDDPALMFLLARAQSLSGRPHDALVMLQRLAARGIARLEAETHDDFARARHHPAWPATLARLREAEGERPTETAPAPSGRPTSAPASADGASRSAGEAPDAPPSPVAPVAPGPPAAGAAPVAPAAPAPRLVPAVGRAVAMAYDAVSARMVLADDTSNTLKIVSELSGKTVDLVTRGWSGTFATTAIALDSRRGDLWVAGVDAADTRSALHRLQLISGRLLYAVPAPEDAGPTRFVDIALANAQVLLLDAAGGRIFALTPGARALQLRMTLTLKGVTNLATADGDIVYVAHRDGLARVNLANRTSVPLAAATDVTLEGLEWIARGADSLLAIQRQEGGLVARRLRLNRGGRVVLSAETLGPAASRAATVLDGVFYYLEPAEDGGGATIRSVTLR